jgi:hypothetical protein
VHEAALEIPAEEQTRLVTSEKMSDEDRESIIQIARKALGRFQAKPPSEKKSWATPRQACNEKSAEQEISSPSFAR